MTSPLMNHPSSCTSFPAFHVGVVDFVCLRAPYHPFHSSSSKSHTGVPTMCCQHLDAFQALWLESLGDTAVFPPPLPRLHPKAEHDGDTACYCCVWVQPSHEHMCAQGGSLQLAAVSRLVQQQQQPLGGVTVHRLPVHAVSQTMGCPPLPRIDLTPLKHMTGP